MENQTTTPLDTNTPSDKVKNRSPLLAAVLAYLVAGLGHLYVGKFQRAMVIIGIYSVLLTIIVITRIQHYYAGTLMFISLVLALNIVMIVDAFRLAKRQRPYVMKRYNRWYFYIGYLILAASISLYISEYRGRICGFESFRIPSTSMEPTIQRGDFIVVDRWIYDNNPVKRGDLIVFQYPKDPSIDYISRVIALPGEEMKYLDKQIYLNGDLMPQHEEKTYSSLAMPDEKLTQKIEILDNLKHKILLTNRHPTINTTMLVPEGHYLVMGDNRDNANDSRYWGYVPADNIKGKALYVWFSFSKTEGFRTERFDQLLQ